MSLHRTTVQEKKEGIEEFNTTCEAHHIGGEIISRLSVIGCFARLSGSKTMSQDLLSATTQGCLGTGTLLRMENTSRASDEIAAAAREVELIKAALMTRGTGSSISSGCDDEPNKSPSYLGMDGAKDQAALLQLLLLGMKQLDRLREKEIEVFKATAAAAAAAAANSSATASYSSVATTAVATGEPSPCSASSPGGEQNWIATTRKFSLS